VGSPQPDGGEAVKPAVWYIAAGYLRSAGVEVYLLHYATELRRQGFDTRVVVFERLPTSPHRCMRELAERGIPLESLYDAVAPVVRGRMATKWLPWAAYMLVRGRVPRAADLRQWLMKRAAVQLLADRINEEKPDIVHVKGRLIAEAWPAIPAESAVFHVATRGQRDLSWTDAEVAAFRPFVSSAARVFAPGTEVAQNFKREFEIERDVEVIYTMAPEEQESRVASRESHGTGSRHATPGTRQAPLRFGTLCRLADGKGIPEILEALAAFRGKHGHEMPFTFAGEGPMAPMIRTFCEERELREVAIVPVESPAQAMAHMDVFLLPSVSEAMPLALVEALMCGRPCIVTPVGGIPDLVDDGEEGLVIEPGSAEQILSAMERFVAMPAAERAEFSRRARAKYEDRCLPGRVAATVAAHYRAILKESGLGVTGVLSDQDREDPRLPRPSTLQYSHQEPRC
jgi:glycosyltransferase involved in cell wall biosynthesis